jgi:hypothetical protein
MPAANIVENDGASSWKRALGSLRMATVQVLVIWKLLEASSTARWTRIWIAAPATGLLSTAAYAISTTGRLTQKILWWALLSIVSIFAVDIFKLMHDSVTKDPFWAVFTDGSWLVLCIFWIRHHPLATKASRSIQSSVSMLRDEDGGCDGDGDNNGSALQELH